MTDMKHSLVVSEIKMGSSAQVEHFSGASNRKKAGLAGGGV